MHPARSLRTRHTVSHAWLDTSAAAQITYNRAQLAHTRSLLDSLNLLSAPFVMLVLTVLVVVLRPVALVVVGPLLMVRLTNQHAKNV